MISTILAVLVAVLHLGFLYLEMFLWTKPAGLKVFRNDQAFAEKSKVLAANQGLYNGFLSAGLIWAALHPDVEFSAQLKMFFFACVIVAGVYGAVTVSKRIMWMQAMPAILGVVAVYLRI